MTEAKKDGGSDEKLPSASSLSDAVVAALAQRESEAEIAAKVEAGAATKAEDEPVVSVVTIGGAVVVGTSPKSDDPELTVGAATEADVETASDKSDGSVAESAKAAEPAAPEPAAAAVEAKPTESPPPAEPKPAEVKPAAHPPLSGGGNEEQTAPRGFAVSREVPEGIWLRYFGRTDVGLVREHNEDNFLVVDVSASTRGIDDKPIDATLGDRGCVLAVCDGMGGAAAGEVASQMAVDTIHEMMTSAGPPKDRDHFARRLVRAVEEAGSRIFSAAKLDRTRRGMGTTSTVAGLVDNTLFVGQVGDSRAYVLRGDQFALITKDQSLVNQLIEAGQLTEEEAEAFEHPNTTLLGRGPTEGVTVALPFLGLRRGGRWLLCSDGRSGLVHADMMKDVLRASRDLVEAANQLIAMANAGGGHDNITVIIAEFDGTGLKEPAADAKVAYQQYPLPPAGPDAIDPPPPRPAGVKAATAKPGADVKSASLAGADPDAGGAGRWWVVAVLVLLVLALLGAIFLSMEDPELASAPPTRSTLSTGSRGAPPPGAAVASSGHLRFDGTHAGATLEIDGTAQGALSSGSMVVDVAPGAHSVRVLRDGEIVASAEVSVEAGHHEFVELVAQAPREATAEPMGLEPPPEPVGVEPPPEPMGVEPPPEMVELAPVAPRAAQDVAERRPASADDEQAPGGPGYVRREGDLPHEPSPRPTP